MSKRYRLLKDLSLARNGDTVSWNMGYQCYMVGEWKKNHSECVFFSQEEIDHNPKWFELIKEQKEREWEIVAFSVVKGDITLVLPKMEGLFTNGFDSWTEEYLLKEKDVSIHSVRRLSDMEAFTVGDFIKVKEESIRKGWSDPIISFLIVNDAVVAEFQTWRMPLKDIERMHKKIKVTDPHQSQPFRKAELMFSLNEIQEVIRTIKDGAKGHDTKNYLNDIFYSRFKEKSTIGQKEWEIVSFKHSHNNSLWELKEDGFYHYSVQCFSLNALLSNRNQIHSVRRLSDGEVFSVGLRVINVEGSEKVIRGFDISSSGREIEVKFSLEKIDYNWLYQLKRLPSTPQPEQQKERIEVIGIQSMNKGVHPRSNPSQNWFKFLIMNEDISPEKYPAIKSALEAVLNNDEQKSDLPKCNICGGVTVLIRGKYPGCDKRNVCPQCTTERLEQIEQIANPNYGQTCKA